MGLFNKFINQTRKPEGLLGKLMVGGMNGGHAKLADWGMGYLDGIPVRSIAELGCGGGRNAAELLKRYPDAVLTALDYSEISVRKTEKTNQAAINAGQCKVMQGDVSSLPFKDASFDLATAFETVYFWPGPDQSFSEVSRILRPGGVFMICNESDGTDETSLKYEKIIEGMKCYTKDQLTTALKAAGFSSVRSEHHSKKPWIVVIGYK